MKPNPFLDEETKTRTATVSPRDKQIQFYLDTINEWFFREDTSNFDPTFFEDTEEFYIERGYLTDKQFEGLENIYHGWICK